MTVTDILYTLIIWPLRLIIEFIFVLFSRLFYDEGLAVVFLSLIINTLLLPIYSVADRWQREERLLQSKMKKKLAELRAVFKGDERQMIINTYYRQMGYSPLFALKSSVGLLLQIPFFIAAYQFLAHTPSFSGVSFWILPNLGAPDGLLHWGTTALNVMPVVMTAVNIVSSLLYTRDLGLREKAPLFGMALLFLVLLYNSPSGLVLYWTMNNLFSLGKNLAAAKLKNPGRALQWASSVFAVLFIIVVLSGIADADRYKYLFAGLGFCLLIGPFAWRGLLRLTDGLAMSAKDCTLLYVSSMILLCLLLGVLIPAQVISASVSDFDRPWLFIIRTFMQSIAFVIVIPLLIRAFANTRIRKILALGSGVCTVLALLCLFALSASYGVMTRSFKIEDTQLILRAFPLWVNPAALLAAVIIPGIFVFLKKQRILCSLFQAASAAVLILAIINMRTISTESRALRELAKQQGDTGREVGGDVFQFTTTGTNTFIMFLDRAIGIALYTALEQMPELSDKLDGFTWYPNTLSFGQCTITGLPPLLGGYDYTPLKINGRRDTLLKDKINESLTMLPKIFGEAGYRVSVTDPTMANMQLVPDISIYAGMKNVKAQNIDGRMDSRFREEFPQKEERTIDSFDFDILFRYGLFRIAPPAFRYGIHYKGLWWRDGASNAYGRGVIEYASLYYLPDICTVDAGAGTLNIFMNETTHEPGAYTADLLPVPGIIHYTQEEIDTFGSENNTSYMYTFMAAMKALERWLDSLKEMGVYDNTRIIVVSDHGSGFDNSVFEDPGMVVHNPLLLVKQPGLRGTLEISDEFMTNADVPALVTVDFDNPVNPYLGTPISGESKNEPLIVASEVSARPNRHGPYLLNLIGTRKLLGRDIFKNDSWDSWQEAESGLSF
jgi:YidC/Oxa1 family membrane protein insertase